MVDSIRTEAGQKPDDDRRMDSFRDVSPCFMNVCKPLLGPASSTYVYLERYDEGVSFRGCAGEENLLKVPYCFPNDEGERKKCC